MKTQTNESGKAQSDFFGVAINAGGKELYSGACKLDAVFAKVPSEGVFTMTLEHSNKRGFAKMFSHFAAASANLGIKVVSPTNVDWYDCAVTGINIPAKVTVSFTNPFAARVLLYTLSIATLVPGKWADTTKDSSVAIGRILHHSQRQGLERLCNEGTGGKKILTTKGHVTSTLVEQFVEARTAILHGDIKPIKVIKTKAKTGEVKTKRTPKAKLTPEQAKTIIEARELPTKEV